MNNINLNIVDHISYFSERRKDQHNEKMKKLVEETKIVIKKCFFKEFHKEERRLLKRYGKSKIITTTY